MSDTPDANSEPESMSFKEALEILGISDYSERIFNSNSRGELAFLEDYFYMARIALKWPAYRACFRELFEHAVKFAEDTWKRPESVFQHMPQMIHDVIKFSMEEARKQ